VGPQFQAAIPDLMTPETREAVETATSGVPECRHAYTDGQGEQMDAPRREQQVYGLSERERGLRGHPHAGTTAFGPSSSSSSSLVPPLAGQGGASRLPSSHAAASFGGAHARGGRGAQAVPPMQQQAGAKAPVAHPHASGVRHKTEPQPAEPEEDDAPLTAFRGGPSPTTSSPEAGGHTVPLGGAPSSSSSSFVAGLPSAYGIGSMGVGEGAAGGQAGAGQPPMKRMKQEHQGQKGT